MGNAAIGQSGGPTAVINQSLVGVIEGLRGFAGVRKVYGMRHGVSGLIKSPPALVEVGRLSPAKLNAIARTPSSALGSSRDKPDAAYCGKILESCRAAEIRYFFYIGGNDSSDTCRIVSELAASTGYDMRCFHVPKTVDNDLVQSDHCPGFPSAARYVATAFMADNLDNASLPGVKINVVMGRHAGFLTAASVLGRRNRDDGPHLIYLPEVPFDNEGFVRDVQAVYDRLGRCQIAVSEGIQTSDGRPVAETLIDGLERDAHGNVQLSGVGGLGDALANVVKSRVKRSDGKPPRVRADTLGYLQRCWPDFSPVDAREARAAGKFAAKLAASGAASGSVALVRARGKAYKAVFERVELKEIAAKTRHMPAEFIDGRHGVTPAFVQYAAPLVGKLPEFARI
ncbi:MAG: 6-phosphofructokinase [Phycisphaerales bacterium]|nr:6-phosphofructokinase [Phycisphaerales bacterium]